MSLAAIEIVGYRSVRKLRMPLRQLTVLTGSNGVGKTNLYRSLELLQAAAKGTLSDEIAREGGLASLFWAGGRNLSEDGIFDPRYRTDGYRKHEANRLALAIELEGLGNDGSFDPTYRIEVGFPPPGAAAALANEAQVKSELLQMKRGGRAIKLLERRGGAMWTRDSSGARAEAPDVLLASETALSFPNGQSELGIVRQTLLNWRFFHSFRSDADSPLRRPCRAITSPLLAADGGNLAAVFATLRYIREETVDLDAAIEDAFPGARLIVPVPEEFASFEMLFPQTPKRPFRAHELSDGTLQFLALLGALTSYRAPPFIALNEPEASLHPRLLPALARAIARAAERAQVWVVTHSRELAAALEAETGADAREVILNDNGTSIRGLTHLGQFDDD